MLPTLDVLKLNQTKNLNKGWRIEENVNAARDPEYQDENIESNSENEQNHDLDTVSKDPWFDFRVQVIKKVFYVSIILNMKMERFL